MKQQKDHIIINISYKYLVIFLILVVPCAMFNMGILIRIWERQAQQEIRIANIEKRQDNTENELNLRGGIGNKYNERLNSLESKFNKMEESLNRIDSNIKLLLDKKNLGKKRAK